MRAFQSAYLGWHEFPKGLGQFELNQWFTFDVHDRRCIRRAFRSRYWIGAALQLGFLAMTGTTLASFAYVPAVLMRHLSRQFVQKAPDLATLRSLYQRRQTLYRHQRWAIDYWGLVEFDSQVEQRLTAYIRERTHATLSRVRLEQLAREWLDQAYVEMPRTRAISDLVRNVIHSVLNSDHEILR